MNSTMINSIIIWLVYLHPAGTSPTRAFSEVFVWKVYWRGGEKHIKWPNLSKKLQMLSDVMVNFKCT